MGRRLKREEVMTIGVLADRGMSRRGIARQIGVSESSVRYQLQRRAEGAVDGRSKQVFLRIAWIGCCHCRSTPRCRSSSDRSGRRPSPA